MVACDIRVPYASGNRRFRAVGWSVIPYSVDERTRGGYELSLDLTASSRLRSASTAIYEWVALIEYRLLGWTQELYPAP